VGVAGCSSTPTGETRNLRRALEYALVERSPAKGFRPHSVRRRALATPRNSRDGGNVRHGLNKDLGFTAAGRVENIHRIAEMARVMTDGIDRFDLVHLAVPRAERRLAREIAAEGEFLEIFVDTSLAEAIRRDPKGLCKRALAASN
jgi:adenylylsulfate kinase-like enzyme